MRQRINDLVDLHPVRLRGEPDVSGEVGCVGPLPPVTHVGIPVDQDHRTAGVVFDRAKHAFVSTLLPHSPFEERAKTGRLWKAVELIEAAVDRMRAWQIDDAPVRKDTPHLLLHGRPLGGPMEVVERKGPAAQEELAQYRDLSVRQLKVSRLDDLDPWIAPEVWILQRQDHRFVDLNRSDGTDAA